MLTEYSEFLNRGLVKFQGGVSVIGSQFMPLMRTYILQGDFRFFEGPKCLFTADGEEILMNRESKDQSLCMIDNIHGTNWIDERLSYYNKFESAKNLPEIELSEENLVLINTQWGASNVFHLIFDSIGKLAVLSEFDDCFSYKYLIPSNMPLCKEIMALLKLPHVTFDCSRIHKGNVIVPSMPSYCGHIPRSVCKSLSTIGNQTFGTQYKTGKSIFIGRKSPSTRLILNQDEIFKFLNTIDDFELVFLEDLTLFDQINKIRLAKLVVGPHGAGLSWNVFSDSPNLFEIHSPNYKNDCFRSLIINSLGNYSSMSGISSSDGRYDNFLVPLDIFALAFLDFYKSINFDYSQKVLYA